MKRYFQLFGIALVALAVYRLYHENKLIMYIHPSTLWMIELAAAVLGILVICMVIFQTDHTHVTIYQVSGVILVALILISARGLPLSLSLVMSRQTNAIPVGRDTLAVHGDPKTYTVLDWVTAWDTDPTHQEFVNSPADIIGFLTKQGDTYYVTRLLITCCIVDAQPVSVAITPVHAMPALGTWVEITGSMKGGGTEPYMTTVTLKTIPVPKQQYVY